MRFQIGDNHVTALLLAGLTAEAVSSAERLCAEAPELPGAAQLLSAAVAGRAALYTGRLDTARAVLDTACELLLDDVNGLGYRYQIARTIALATLGSTAAATAGLAVLERQRHPSWRFVDHEASVAHAWVAACRGAVSEAVATLSEAAETARHNGQFAAEVMCLQTAAQFGDRTSGTRLHELSTMVEGPRAGIAARFASALHADCGAELNAASEEFEHMGDLVAAADAAAHAAIAYRHHDLRGSGLACSARAEMLAQRCGGAVTPALRQAAEPVPLTDREREIVMLIGEGLSNRAVAQQLTLSVRTVEGHIYRAMARTGVTSREELAALLPRR
jgi:DNA-binding CsgD family transcriptional regulator